MPAAVIAFPRRQGAPHRASWSLIEIAPPGASPKPLGILLIDEETNRLRMRLSANSRTAELEEQAIDFLEFLEEDLNAKAEEMGARELVATFEDSLSNFLRISDRTTVEYSGEPRQLLDRLFEQHVGVKVIPFETHLPLYAIRAAATKFGGDSTGEEREWVPAPPGVRLTEDMFVVEVVGRSMEPLIPDGSLCVFRRNVTGTRQGKRLLIEKFGETSDASRYTVKVYSSKKQQASDDEWTHERILLKPLNREFEAFELGPDEFRVIGEFVTVLDSD